MMRSLPLFFLLMMFPFTLHGQDGLARTGTPYSSIAFGQPADLLSPGTAGMGLIGVAVYDPYSANNANPALWGVSPYTQGAISFEMQNIDAVDGLGRAAGYSEFTINQFQVVVPLVRSRLGMSVGFFPVTRSNFDLGSQGAIGPEDAPLEFFNRVEGSGGVNKMEVGFGYILTDNLTVGYAASLHFATIDREYAFESEDFNSLHYTDSLNGRAFGHRFGLYGRASGIFSSRDEASFGAAVSLPVNISADRSATSYRNIGNQVRYVDVLPENGARTGEIQIPVEFNVGLTYNPSPLVEMGLEFQQQMWGEVQPSFNLDQEQHLVDRSKMGMGVQYRPYARDGIGGGFLSNFKYSAGASYDTGHIMFGNQRVETLLFHTGIGILSRQTRSSVDLGFQFGFRGTEAQNLIRETIWGVKLSVNLAEWMFQRSRFQ